jgi:eukaryotic-like serine/threonine-protein kinase
MGSVYRAGRIGLEREVAVKFIDSRIARDPDFRRRFEQELRAMGRLKHPNCVSVIDYGFESLPYLVMELVDGQSLRALLGVGAVPPRRALAITRQLLAGLAHAHAKGIIHRDVKPENVLLERVIGVPDDYVRIVDFGLAKLLDGASSVTHGKVLGSPHYMPPEQMRAGDIDARMDIYSTGIVLFEMLTGRRPFEGANIGEVLLAQKQQTAPPLSKAAPGLAPSPALERLVQRALEKYPGDRFRSALDMQKAIEALPELGGGNGVPVIQAPETQPPPQPEAAGAAIGRVRSERSTSLGAAFRLLGRHSWALARAWARALRKRPSA